MIMTKYETKLIESVLRYRYSTGATIIVIFAVLVRYWGRDCLTGDTVGYLLPWYESFKINGFSGLEKQVGDYNLMYQTVLAFLAKTSYNPLYIIKIFSVFFDFVLTGLFVYIVNSLFGVKDRNILFVAFASVLMLVVLILLIGDR